MTVFRSDSNKISIISANWKNIISFITLVICCCKNKKKELNTNLSPIQEAKVIISFIPERIRIIENLCKLAMNETGKIIEKECVS